MVTIYRLNDFLLAVYKLLTSSHVLVISLSRVTTVSDWRSSDNCLRMLPLNQSEQIGVWMLKFHPTEKIFNGKWGWQYCKTCSSFSSRLTWQIGLSVVCLLSSVIFLQERKVSGFWNKFRQVWSGERRRQEISLNISIHAHCKWSVLLHELQSNNSD